MKALLLTTIFSLSVLAQLPPLPYAQPTTVVVQKWFGVTAPSTSPFGAAYLPGDLYFNTAVSPVAVYFCAAPQGTPSPACTSVAIGQWTLLGASGVAVTSSALRGDGTGNAIAVTGSGSNCVHVDGTSASCAGAAGADTALDNLSAVSINTSLLAQTGVDAGSTTNPFRNLYLWGTGTYGSTSIKLTGAPTGNRVAAFPDASITVARSDAAQTFTGVQTFSTPIATGSGGTGAASLAGANIVVAGAANAPSYTASGTTTCNFSGTLSCLVTGPSSGGTSATTLAFSNMTNGNVYMLTLVDGTSLVTWTFPSTTKGYIAPAVVSTQTQQSFYFDGTNMWGLGGSSTETPSVNRLSSTRSAPTQASCASGATNSAGGCDWPDNGTLTGLGGTPDRCWYISTSSNAFCMVLIGSDINPTLGEVISTHLSAPLPNTQGGTGTNSSSSTGVAQVNGGTWSYSTALANGTTATTQSAQSNDTKVATDAYVDGKVPGTAVPASSVTLAGSSQIFVCTTTCTVTVPVPSINVQYCVMNDDNVSTVITLSAIGSSASYENTARTAYGTAGTGTFVSGGAVGDFVCLIGRDSTHYLTPSSKGTWTAN